MSKYNFLHPPFWEIQTQIKRGIEVWDSNDIKQRHVIFICFIGAIHNKDIEKDLANLIDKDVQLKNTLIARIMRSTLYKSSKVSSFLKCTTLLVNICNFRYSVKTVDGNRS